MLNDGHIQQVDAPQEVYERPVNACVSRFMGHHKLYRIVERDGTTLATEIGVLQVESDAEGGLVLMRPETLNLKAGHVEGLNHLHCVIAERL